MGVPFHVKRGHGMERKMEFFPHLSPSLLQEVAS